MCDVWGVCGYVIDLLNGFFSLANIIYFE